MKKSFSNRRNFIKKTAVFSLLPTMPFIPTLAQANTNNLIVGTWGGDYQRLLQDVISPIVAKDKIDVIFETANAPARNTKLKAERNSRRGSMDIALLGDVDMYEVSAVNALNPVTTAEVPNLENVFEQFRTPYSIPHLFSAMVIVYNTEKFSTPPTSFRETLDPKLKGKVGFSDILYYFNTLFAGLAEGSTESSYAPGMAFLRKLKANNPKVFPSNEAVAAAFKSEEIWITCMWKARALQWRDAGLPLGFIIPDEGAIPALFEAAVPKNSRNKDNAWKYMNALLDPEGQIKFAETMGYAPTVKNAKLPPELQARVGFTPEEIARIHKFDLAALAAGHAECLDFWNKEFKPGL